MTDPMAERVRKIGGVTLRSIGQISRLQRILDNDAGYVTPLDMLAELRDDNKQMAAGMREMHSLCDEHEDVATAGLLETSIDRLSAAPGFFSKLLAGMSDKARAPLPFGTGTTHQSRSRSSEAWGANNRLSFRLKVFGIFS